MSVQMAECEGCNEVKPIPLIMVEAGSPPLQGLCAECVQKFRMQVGADLRLKEPGRHGEAIVKFVAPADDSIWIRYSDGTTERMGWSALDRGGA